MVDCHVHLTMSGTNDQNVRQEQLSISYGQVEPEISRRLRQHLSHGIVALRDGGDSAGHTLHYRVHGSFLETCPVILKAAGKAWRAKGRYGRLIGRPPAEGTTLAQGVLAQDYHADHIKIIHSGLNSLREFGKQTAPQFSPHELKGGFDAARRRGWRIMVHANGEAPVRLAVEAGCHSIEHGFFMGRENMERLASARIRWAPTAFSMKAYCRELDPESPEVRIAEQYLEHQLGQIALAWELGVPIVVGTDSGGLGIYHGPSFVEELRLLQDAGLSVEEAIRCATLEGARLLGIEGIAGRLKEGMPATLVAVPAPPSRLFAALAAPELVLVGGRRIQATPATSTLNG
jgi:imidazolonepropionase-like amidohydrolase